LPKKSRRKKRNEENGEFPNLKKERGGLLMFGSSSEKGRGGVGFISAKGIRWPPPEKRTMFQGGAACGCRDVCTSAKKGKKKEGKEQTKTAQAPEGAYLGKKKNEEKSAEIRGEREKPLNTLQKEKKKKKTSILPKKKQNL